MSRLSANYQDELKRRIAARRALKREQTQSSGQDSRLTRIEGHEGFWVKAITLALARDQVLRRQVASIIPAGAVTEKDISALLAHSAQARGRTYNEALMFFCFNVCQLGYLKENR